MVERENRTGGEELASLLKKLPLETCRYKCDIVTEEWGWRAPKDRVFRISGHFIIRTDQSTNEMGVYIPQDSADILREEHSKEYQKFLKETKGDEDAALELLTESLSFFDKQEIPPKFFDGKWLVMEKGDGTEPPNFFVKKDVYAWYDPDPSLQVIKDIAPESETVTECLFTSPIGEICWIQEYAEPVLSKCKIELIESPDEEKKLYIPKTLDKKHQSEQDITVWTKRRPGKKQGKELRNFTENNKDLAFSEPDQSAIIYDVLSIAYRKPKKIIISGKGKVKKPAKNSFIP